MTIAMGQMQKFGPLRVTPICETSVNETSLGGGIFLAGNKRPLAILIAQDTTLAAFDTDGKPLSQSEIESLCPGAWNAALND